MALKNSCASGCSLAKSRDEGVEISVFFFKFLFYDMSCNITKQLTENKLKHGIVPMRTKIKILQLNRLEANSFFR